MFIIRTRLVTAHIVYRRPDHKWLLQDYVWQDYDKLPDYPALRKFVVFWREKLDGPIHSIEIADAEVNRDELLRFAEFSGVLQ